MAQHSTDNAEQALAKLIEEEVKFGKPVRLNDGQHSFLGVFTPNKSGTTKGGVVILHDAGSHPNHNEIIHPIRQMLPLHGWATLAIQLPMINNIEQYALHQDIINKRIEKAIEYFSTLGINNIVLIGHGTGAISSALFLTENKHNVRAYIGISLGILPETDPPKSVPALLEKISIPVLDIFGSRDTPFVIRSADARALVAKSSGNSKSENDDSFNRSAIATDAGNHNIQGYIAYRQIKIEGADHNFTGKSQLLSKRVLGWLNRHAKNYSGW